MTKFIHYTAAAILGLTLAGSSAQAADQQSVKTAQGPYGFSNGGYSNGGYSGYGQFNGGNSCGRCAPRFYGNQSYNPYNGGFDSTYGGYGSGNQYLGSSYSMPDYGAPSGGGFGGGYGGGYSSQFGPSNFQNQYVPNNQFAPSQQTPPAPYLPNQYGPSMNSGYSGSGQSFSQPYSGFGQPGVGAGYTQPMAGYSQPFPSYNQGQSGFGTSLPGYGQPASNFGQPLNSYSQPTSSPFYP